MRYQGKKPNYQNDHTNRIDYQCCNTDAIE